MIPDPEGAVAEFAQADQRLNHANDVAGRRGAAYDGDPTEANRLTYRAALEQVRDAHRAVKSAEDLVITYQLPQFDAQQVEFINRHRADREKDAQRTEQLIDLLDQLGEARRRLGR